MNLYIFSIFPSIHVLIAPLPFLLTIDFLESSDENSYNRILPRTHLEMDMNRLNMVCTHK